MKPSLVWRSAAALCLIAAACGGPTTPEAEAPASAPAESQATSGAEAAPPSAGAPAAANPAPDFTLPDLDAEYPLPPAPWFPPGGTRSVRRAIVHIIAETAQHAGHADIIRESVDGQKTMG